MNLLQSAVYFGMQALPTAQEFQRGSKDVEVELKAGGSQTVRLTRLAPRLQQRVLLGCQGDLRKLSGAMLPPEWNTDAFFQSLTDFGFSKLGFCAVALCSGPDLAAQQLAAGAERIAES